MDRERLERLTREGDRHAALRLLSTARRRGDRGAAVRAATALDDVDAVVGQLLEAWKHEAWTELTLAARALGLELDADRCQQIDEALRRAHHRRKVRLLSRPRVVHTLVEARLAKSYATTSAGRPPSRGATTVCLAVQRDNESCVVGVARADAQTPSDVDGWAASLGDWEAPEKHARAVQWAQLAPAPDQVLVPTCPLRVDATRARQGRAPRMRRLQLLASVTPDDDVFDAMAKLIGSWPRRDDAARAVAMARDALRPFPVERRTVTPTSELRRRRRPRLHPLTAHLVLRLPIDRDLLERLQGLEQVRSLELVEPLPHHTVDAGGAVAAIADTPLASGVRRLSLRVRSQSALRAVVALPMLAQLTTLRVVRGDPMDLSWGKLHAALYERCTSLAHFELVHRSPLSYMIPALKRLRRLESLRLALGRVGYRRLEQAMSALRRTSPLRLDLGGSDLRAGALPVVCDASCLGRLEELALANCHVDGRALRPLARARFAGSLRALTLSRNALGPDARLGALLAIGRLEELRLDRCQLEVATLAPLLEAEALSLRALDVQRNALGPALGRLLRNAPSLEQLRELSVGVTDLDGGATEILQADWFASLESLDLRRARGGAEWIAALGARPPAELRHLDLGRCELNASSVEHLTDTAALDLETLRIDHNALRVRGIEALARWPRLASLARLDVRRTGGGNAGRAALTSSPWLRGLVAGIDGSEHALPWRRRGDD